MADSIIARRVWAVFLVFGVVCAGCEEQPAPATTVAPAIDAEALEASLTAAQRYLDGGDTASAAVILEAVLGKVPDDFRAHELYGAVLYLQGVRARGRGEDATAEQCLTRAAEHYQSAVNHASNLSPSAAAGLRQSAGEIASAAGRSEQALALFRAAAEEDPLNPKHSLYEAQVLVGLGRDEAARVALNRVLSLTPGDAYALATLAGLDVKAGDRESAIGNIEAARRADPQSLAIRVQESRIRRTCGDPRRGLEVLVGLHARTRAEEAVAHEIAECYLALDRPADAATAWELRFARHPEHPTAWRAAVGVAGARLAAGELNEARQWWSQANRLAAHEPEVVDLGRRVQSAGGP
jgi:tetratricopeptide (TPR) repeat protein